MVRVPARGYCVEARGWPACGSKSLVLAARAWGALGDAVTRDHAPLVPVYYDRTLSLNGSRVGGLRLHDILGGTSLENASVR